MKYLVFGATFLTLAACGPGLRDGNYVGEPRFVLQGTLDGVVSAPQESVKALRISVLWQMVAMPHPPPAASENATAGSQNDSGASDSSPATPAGDGNAATAPRPIDQATGSGQDTQVVQVAFPAPVSLNLYDFPETEPDWPAREAEGTVVVFFDRNGDGRYDAGSETIAATLRDHRILYQRHANSAGFYFVNSLLDNSSAFGAPMSLARRECVGTAEHLTVVPNQAVSLVAEVPAPCGL